MSLFRVISVGRRRIKGVNGFFTAPDGFVMYAGYHHAKDAESAIESATSYYMGKEARKGKIRAEVIA